MKQVASELRGQDVTGRKEPERMSPNRQKSPVDSEVGGERVGVRVKVAPKSTKRSYQIKTKAEEGLRSQRAVTRKQTKSYFPKKTNICTKLELNIVVRLHEVDNSVCFRHKKTLKIRKRLFETNNRVVEN